ncbi:MAG: transglycosylase SLT domain-containing protein [Succinivibrio sp.]|nr:transglycosylase SLT domain-containing protein [Succinivibrio sp.]
MISLKKIAISYLKPLVVVPLCLASGNLNAASTTPNVTAPAQALITGNAQTNVKREAFKEARELAKAGDIASVNAYKRGRLKDYPLNIWLDYYYLSSNPTLGNYESALKFIRSGQHKELGQLLADKYVDFLADKGQFKKIRQIYEAAPYPQDDKGGKKATIRKCRYHEAAWHTGQGSGDAVAFAHALYSDLKSYPDKCAGLISLWKTKGYLTNKIKLEKYEKAYVTRRYEALTGSLGTELARQPHYQGLIERAKKLYKDPASLFTASGVSGRGAGHDAAVLAFKRLANLDGSAASERYDEFVHKVRPSEAERMEVLQTISGSLLGRQSSQADLAWVDQRLPAAMWTEELKEKRLRRAIWYAQWDKVSALLNTMPKSLQNEVNWKYWKGRALMATGHSSQGRAIMAEVARDRSFFGFLAAQDLGDRLPFNHRHLDPAVKWTDKLSHHAAVQRFFELYAMGDKNADIEWRELVNHASDDVAMLMGEWALSTSNTTYAIQTAISGGRWDALNYRFPYPYLDLYRKYSRQQQVPLSFLYGISRQESMMQPWVKSPAGAVGLMQLMPGTAQLVSKKNHWQYKGVSDLLIPENNIRLGSAYLRNMLDKFGNNRVLAAAAYNAGPNRIFQWASKDGLKRDAAVYIENIPFQETRKYVQNVLLYDAIYSKLIEGTEQKTVLKNNELAFNY